MFGQSTLKQHIQDQRLALHDGKVRQDISLTASKARVYQAITSRQALATVFGAGIIAGLLRPIKQTVVYQDDETPPTTYTRPSRLSMVWGFISPIVTPLLASLLAERLAMLSAAQYEEPATSDSSVDHSD